MIVITGAAGLIGSEVVRYLNILGNTENLVLVDNIDHPHKFKNLQDTRYRLLLPISNLFEWLQGKEREIQAFIHLGACSNTLETNEQFLWENNVQYSQKLALYAMKYEKRFIYASSAATYGDGSLGFSDDHEMLGNLKPLNLYGRSKHLFDLWAKENGFLDRLVGLKYFNVFGPHEAHKGKMASMVFKTIPSVKEKGIIYLFKSHRPALYKDGEQCRDFIYVRDAVRMSCEFLNNTKSGIFNIGMGIPTTWNRLAEIIFKSWDLPVRIVYIDIPHELSLQYQDYTCAEMQKYYEEVGVTPLDGSLERGVSECLTRYLSLYPTPVQVE